MKKVILITGASAGMGKEAARLLAQHGHIVYAVARRTERMKDLEQYGVKTLYMDVTNDDSMTKGIDTIVAAEGKIDVLVNNAGFGSHGAIEDVSINDAKYQLEVNLFGAARLMQLVIPHMRQQHRGRIINISSIGGKFATPLGGWYHASKFALEGLSDALRMEVRPFGIDVVVIEPGGVKSEWSEIAMQNAERISGHSVYKSMVEKFVTTARKIDPKSAKPIVIARLIEKAIITAKPKTRYVAGYLAKPILFARKILSDRMLDSVLMSQLK